MEDRKGERERKEERKMEKRREAEKKGRGKVRNRQSVKSENQWQDIQRATKLSRKYILGLDLRTGGLTFYISSPFKCVAHFL